MSVLSTSVASFPIGWIGYVLPSSSNVQTNCKIPIFAFKFEGFSMKTSSRLPEKNSKKFVALLRLRPRFPYVYCMSRVQNESYVLLVVVQLEIDSRPLTANGNGTEMRWPCCSIPKISMTALYRFVQPWTKIESYWASEFLLNFSSTMLCESYSILFNRHHTV